MVISGIANSVFCQTKNILFLGNSYTYYNEGLPEMFKMVAESKGKSVETYSNSPGGYTFSMHSTNSTSLNLISSQIWDFVVLQEQSQLPSFPPSQVETDVYPYATILCDSIRANSHCTTPLFFMTWGRKNGDASNCTEYPPICTYLGMQWRLRQSYVEMAGNNDAWVAPVGMAFKSVITSNPEIELYSGDESHPSYCGTYLAACTFFSVIFNESSLGAYIPEQVTADQALVLQNAAWNVVIDSLDIWRIDTTTVRADFEPMFQTKTVLAQFANYSVNADSCLWNFGDGSLAIMQYPVFDNIYDIMYHTYPEEAEYNICLTAYKGCNSVDTCKIRDIIISEFNNSAVNTSQLFPNPANDIIFIDNENYVGSNAEIFDITGKIIKSVLLTENEMIIKVNDLTEGLYLIRIKKDEIKTEFKLVISR